MTRSLAFFGHNRADAAIRRRVRSLLDDGYQVTGFMMRRDVPQNGAKPVEWPNIELGETHDGAFLQRIKMIFQGAKIAVREGEDTLRAADIFYARNLDMLASAFLVKRTLKLQTPVIYECLDVHRKLVGSGPVSRVLRMIERQFLKRSAGLVVSSPGFLKNYFEKYHKGLYTAHLIENRLASGAEYGPRPALAPIPKDRPLRLGWYGILRCERSLGLLIALADEVGSDIEIHLHGKISEQEIKDFHSRIAGATNIVFSGAYKSPEDLARIYADADLVWAGDFMEAGYNSVWLLPNRIYEGGYFATPPIAPKGTQTGKWIETHGCGFTISEPLEETLPKLVRHLQGKRQQIEEKQNILLSLPDTVFIQPHGEVGAIIDRVLALRTSS